MNFTGKEWKSLRERNRNCGYVDLFFYENLCNFMLHAAVEV